MRSKTAGGILTKLWQPEISVCIKSARRSFSVLFFFSLAGQWHDPGVLGFLFLLGGCGGCGEGTGCMTGDDPGFRLVIFFVCKSE